MNGTSALHLHGQAPPMLARALARTAMTGIDLVRGLPRDIQRGARARAATEGTSLSKVLVHARILQGAVSFTTL